MEHPNNGPEGIRDAAALGRLRMLILGTQHLFAMFGATVLVPALTGLDVSATLFFAGAGTLLFHLVTGGRVPAFLGSSFAFLGGYAAIAPLLPDPETGLATAANTPMLPYACAGVAAAGGIYLALSFLLRRFGAQKILRCFPPIVTGPIIICIGLSLAGSAIENCRSNWLVALAAAGTVVFSSTRGRGAVRTVPVLLGVAVSYLFAAVLNPSLREAVVRQVSAEKWFALPIIRQHTALSLLAGDADREKLLTAVMTFVPIALVTVAEHIGDISAISSTVGDDFLTAPGLHRTLLGDGLATALAALFGAPANTTYGENTGVLALTKVYDPKVLRLAAVFSMALSFCPKFAALIAAMPAATAGGVGLVLYGMISAVGIRNLTEHRVDFSKSRNVLIAALILGLGIGISYSGALILRVGSVTLTLSGLAAAVLAGVCMNILLPDK